MNRFRLKLLFFSGFCGIYYYKFNDKIIVDYNKNDINNYLISKSKYMTGIFKSSMIHPFRFIGIIYGNKFDKRNDDIKYNREIFYTSDKENIAIDWVQNNNKIEDSICIILTGIFGSSNSQYIKPLAEELNNKGFHTVVLNPRGLEIPITQNKYFFETHDDDNIELIDYISKKYYDKNIFIVGTSMGASLSCRYLSKNNIPNNIKGFVGISNPYDVYGAASNSTKWYNIIYGKSLGDGMRNSILFNKKRLVELSKKENYNLNFNEISKCKTTFQIDKEFTKKIYPKEYINPQNYYKKMSCFDLIKDIKIPSLFINSLNDPISHKSLIPLKDIKKNKNIILLRTPKGGHVEYFTSIKLERWYVKVTSEYLSNLNNLLKNN